MQILLNILVTLNDINVCMCWFLAIKCDLYKAHLPVVRVVEFRVLSHRLVSLTVYLSKRYDFTGADVVDLWVFRWLKLLLSAHIVISTFHEGCQDNDDHVRESDCCCNTWADTSNCCAKPIPLFVLHVGYLAQFVLISEKILHFLFLIIRNWFG